MKKRRYAMGALVLLLLGSALFLLSRPAAPDTPPQVRTGARSELDDTLLDQGVISLRNTGAREKKLKVQITRAGGENYNYDLDREGAWETYPLTQGDGTYTVSLLEHIEGDRYAVQDTYTLEVALADPLSPFLLPNQIVNYTDSSRAASLAGQIASLGKSDLGKAELLFDYVADHITYDYDKSASVAPGYLPHVDGTLAAGKGICFDYAALLCAMARSQGIPCRLVTGYAGEDRLYHAWVEVWCTTGGTVDGVIPITANAWSRLDPTFVSSSARSAAILAFVSKDENYEALFYY